METNHTVRWDEQESNALEVALEPNGVQNTNTNQRTEAVNIFGESEYFECSKLVNGFSFLFFTPFHVLGFSSTPTNHLFHSCAVFSLFSSSCSPYI